MIIPAVTGFNPYQNTTKYDFQSRAKINSLQTDTFQLQKKFSPSFGSSIIPKDEIFKLLNEFITNEMNRYNDVEMLQQAAEELLFKELDKLLNKTLKLGNLKVSEDSVILEKLNNPAIPFSEKDRFICGGFNHEFSQKCLITKTNVCDLSQTNLETVQKQLEEFIELTRFLTNKWSTIKQLSEKPSQNIPAKDILNMLKEIENTELSQKISLMNLELLGDKKAKNPILLYDYISKFLLDAIRYSERKPIKIKVEQDSVSFLIPKTEKTESIQDLQTSFPEVANLLWKNGHTNNSMSMNIQDEYLCIKAPLIGLN